MSFEIWEDSGLTVKIPKIKAEAKDILNEKGQQDPFVMAMFAKMQDVQFIVGAVLPTPSGSTGPKTAFLKTKQARELAQWILENT